MNRLSKTMIWTIFLLVSTGIFFIEVNLIAVVFISVGATFVFMGMCLLFLECGPRVCYWWVSIRMGCDVKIPHKDYMEHADEIEKWLKDNIAMGFMHVNEGNTYYFLRNTDATGFKLRWI